MTISLLPDNPAAQPMSDGDAIVKISIGGGKIGGSPFYVDNIVLAERRSQ